MSLPSDFVNVATDSAVLPARVQDEKARLQEALCCGVGSVYGSLFSGLISTNAEDVDLDISFPLSGGSASLEQGAANNSPDYTLMDRREMHQQRLAVIASRLRASGYANVEEITRGAAVPLVKCVDPKTGRQIDITVGVFCDVHVVERSVVSRRCADEHEMCTTSNEIEMCRRCSS